MTRSRGYTIPASLRRYLAARQRLVNRALDRCLPRANAYPPVIHQAMRYSVLSRGKRLRAVLCLAAGEVVGGRRAEVLPAACALECIHAYSLIHDDLPAMDDAATRRGQPACHRRYGEGVAILAGDALLALGFELLARGNHAPLRLQALQEVARISGTQGLVGGQVMDLAWQQQNGERNKVHPSPFTLHQLRRQLEYINSHKTAKLISISAKLGALLGGGSPAQVRALERYGFELGIAFQLTDDLLDCEGMAAIAGADTTRALASQAVARATRQLRMLGRAAGLLGELAESIRWRTT